MDKYVVLTVGDITEVDGEKRVKVHVEVCDDELKAQLLANFINKSKKNVVDLYGIEVAENSTNLIGCGHE